MIRSLCRALRESQNVYRLLDSPGNHLEQKDDLSAFVPGRYAVLVLRPGYMLAETSDASSALLRDPGRAKAGIPVSE